MEKFFNKDELLSFVLEFDYNTQKLDRPMLRFEDYNFLNKEDTLNLIEQGFKTKNAIIVYAKNPNSEIWDHIYIEKNIKKEDSYRYLISFRNDKTDRGNEVSNDPKDAIQKAVDMLIFNF